MRKTKSLAWACLLLGVVLACGPTGEPGGTTAVDTPASVPAETPTAGTREPPAAPSACRGRIAFVARHDSQTDLFVINADGSGLAQLTDDRGFENSPSWSPDGTRLLFASYLETNLDIYVISLDDGTIRRLTEDSARDYAPSWSPDGKQVLFLSTRIFSSQVFVLNAEGGEPVPLTEAAAHKMDAAWSPDGERIAFTMLDGYNQGDVHVMSADGSGQKNLTGHAAHDCCVAWSPDGGRLAFLSSRNGGAASNFPADGAYRYGDQLIYAGYEGGSAALPAMPRPLTTVMPEQPRDIYLVNPDGSGLVNLTNGRGYEKDQAWSPDGKWMVFVSDRQGNDEVYVMDVQGVLQGSGAGSPIRLTDSRDDEAEPIWSPDGTCIAFASFGDDAPGLYVMNADGSGSTKLAGDVVQGTGLSWSP